MKGGRSSKESNITEKKKIEPIEPIVLPNTWKLGRTIVHSWNLSSQMDAKFDQESSNQISPPKKSISKPVQQKVSSVPWKVH